MMFLKMKFLWKKKFTLILIQQKKNYFRSIINAFYLFLLVNFFPIKLLMQGRASGNKAALYMRSRMQEEFAQLGQIIQVKINKCSDDCCWSYWTDVR